MMLAEAHIPPAKAVPKHHHKGILRDAMPEQQPSSAGQNG